MAQFKVSERNSLAPKYRVHSAEAESDPNLITVVFLAFIDMKGGVSLFNLRHH